MGIPGSHPAPVQGPSSPSPRAYLIYREQAETYQIQGGLETHGYGGPLKISHGGLFTSVGREFLDVAARYDMRRERTDDPNDMHECNTYGVEFFSVMTFDFCLGLGFRVLTSCAFVPLRYIEMANVSKTVFGPVISA